MCVGSLVISMCGGESGDVWGESGDVWWGVWWCVVGNLVMCGGESGDVGLGMCGGGVW